MYKISVPIINSRVMHQSGGREKVLAEIKRLGAKRVFLALGRHKIEEVRRKKEFEALKENCAFFKEHGFEVGAWTWSFLSDTETEYEKITGENGNKTQENCPMDKDFVKFMQKYISEVAQCGVDIVLFDDDFRFGHLTNSINCTCPLHMKRITEILGEDISPEMIKEKALCGGKNKYRDAWMQANGEALKNFALAMRQALDKQTPHVRMGYCACMSNWGNDGIHAEEIAKILAGKTKPFMRLIGAPYWAVNRDFYNSRLQNIVEFERMQKSWCSNDTEIVSEGDVFPRPRTNCPASYLEIFDTALRADGSLDGIMKYVIDYVSQADYETGYIDMHIRNAEIYKWIETKMTPKTASGVRIYESVNKLETMVLPEKAKTANKIDEIMFSPASKLLADNSVPTVYSGDGVCTIAFAENVKLVPEEMLKNGIITDLRGAEILSEKGIDTGIKSKGDLRGVTEEYFKDINQHVSVHGEVVGGCNINEVELADGAKVISSFIAADKKEIPAAYLYENSDGYRFLVYTFNAFFESDYLFRSYARSKQLADSIKWLSGKKLPAYSYGNPDLYIMAKKDETAMSVGLWNCFADPVFDAAIELDYTYKEIEFINCNGKISGDTVYISKIDSFSFAGFEVKK